MGRIVVWSGFFYNRTVVHLTPELLPAGVAWAGNLIYILVLTVTAWKTPWWHLRISEDTHVLMATCVTLLLIWSIEAGIAPGLNLHLLGVTLATLMFGWQFALLAITAVLLGDTVYAGTGWGTFGWNGLLLACWPVAVSWWVLRVTRQYLPRHFFIYIFVAAFFGAAVTICLVGAASTGLMYLLGVYSWGQLVRDYASAYVLLVFPEAFLTGVMMTLFVIYRPSWVATFNDRCYLKN